ncbi:MAG TPA: efflux RND transporter periplasmic adaptor subunit [candidate division Zixibacteria bacterium]|nr:efflux RND transporter periplasmic adaptor subunit [candidate division Zixibacteria bacterium]
MDRKKMLLIAVVILIAGFAAMMFLMGMRSDVPRREAKARPKIVNTLIAHPKRLMATISGLGKVTSAQPVDLYSEVSGTLMPGDVPFQPAQSFKKGDLLVKIDDRQIILDINSAKSDFLTSLGNVLAEIKSDFPDKYQTWRDFFDACDFDQPMQPLPNTDDQRIKLLLSRFSVYKQYFSIRDMEITLEKHHFYAPFDGTIVSADMRVGSTARNGTLLGKIINLEDMEVEVPIRAEDIKWIRKGTPVELTSNDIDGAWNGKVSRIGSAIDPRTQTIPVYVSVQGGKNADLYDGVYLTASIPGLEIDDAVAVPRHAIYSDSLVYLIKDGFLEPRAVTIARKEMETIIISGGIIEGDTVVVDLMRGVAPGMPARMRETVSKQGS